MKFTTGIVAGAIIGAAAVAGYAVQDRHMRKKMARSGKKVMEKANNMFGGMM